MLRVDTFRSAKSHTHAFIRLQKVFLSHYPIRTMSHNLCFLLATQRSGTNMLRRVLDTHPNICTLPEVFDDSSGRSHLSENGGAPYFHTALLEKIRENAEVGLPANRTENVRNYFKLLENHYVTPDISAIVDVKFSSLHHADGAWIRPSSPPQMLKIIKAHNYPVIVLRREDNVATTISLFRAGASNQYHADRPELIKPVRYGIEPNILLNTIRAHEEQDALVNLWLNRLNPKRIELSYEELFIGEPGSDLDPEAFAAIGRFLNIDPYLFDCVPRMVKVSVRGYREEIENFDELEEALRDTIYHKDLIAGEHSRG